MTRREKPRPSAKLPTAEDARLLARRRQPRLIFDFIDGGAGTEDGLARNENTWTYSKKEIDRRRAAGRERNGSVFGLQD